MNVLLYCRFDLLSVYFVFVLNLQCTLYLCMAFNVAVGF